MIAKITDGRIRELILEKIGELAEDPEKKGKPLTSDLSGFRSIRAVGQRYRIIYRVDKHEVIVVVIGAGIRKEGSRDDIYNIFKRLVHLNYSPQAINVQGNHRFP